jgi:hypothetical protein
MNKLQRLKKKLFREGGVMVGAVVLAGMLMTGAEMLAEQAQKKKSEAETALDQDRNQIQLMQTQISQTGEALAKFSELSKNRTSDRFDNDTEIMKVVLRQLKDRFRLSDSLQLTISQEKISEQPSLQALNYKVVVREDMEITVGAMSDLHVYSALQQFLLEMPGLVRITQVQLSRRAPMSPEAIAQMRAGGVPELAGGKLRFTWITFEEKNAPPASEAPSPSPVPGGS